MKVLRSSLLVATAVVVAACGDKVTVAGPATTTAGVVSIQVAPATATLNLNQSITLTAAISMSDASAPPAAVWSTSDASKVSVSQAGVIVGLAATPGVAICAAAGGKSACATIIVSGAQAVIPASVSIQSVTTNPGGAPVIPGAVAGQIDVRVNVSPGNQTVQRVVLIVGAVRADSQTFTAAQAAALRAAADEAVATQSAFPPILFSVNTAKFNATTGVPTWTNTPQTISVQLFVVGVTAATASATWQTALTFANANTYQLTSSVSGGASANSAAGYAFKSGSIAASVLPVIYSPGITMAAGTITFGTGCDATGGRTIALTAPVAPSTAWTATFTTGTAAAAATNFNNYEFRTAVCPGVIATGEGFTVTATDNNGNAFIAAPFNAPANAAANLYRIDNVGPPVPVANFVMATGAGPNSRGNFWFNDVVALNGKATTLVGATTGVTSDALVCDNQSGVVQGNCGIGVIAPVDAGIGSVVFQFRAAAASGTGSVTTASAAAAITTTAGLDRSASNLIYCGVLQSADALGNKSAAISSASTSTTCATQMAAAGNSTIFSFGVDRDPPFVGYDATSVVANARLLGAALPGQFVLSVSDGGTGGLGVSGMANGKPCLMALSQRTASATSNLTAAGAAASNSTPSSTGVNNTVTVNGLCATAIAGAASTTAAYLTLSSTVVDDAGNSTVAVPRVIVYDNTAATAQPPSVPATITGSFSSASFLNDNLSLRDYYYTITFGGAALTAPVTATIAAAPTVLDAYNAATLSNINFGLNVTINTFLGLQATNAGNVPQAYAANSTPLSGVNLFVRDQTQAAYSGPASGVVAPTAPTTGIAVSAVGPPAWTFQTYVPATSAATLCALAAASAGCTVGAGTPASATWTAVATGTTASFNNPFSRVDFYASNGVDLVLVGSVAAASAINADNGVLRTWTYSLPVTANALFTQLGGVSGGAPGAAIARNVYAFGANSAGTVGLVTQVLVQTINP